MNGSTELRDHLVARAPILTWLPKYERAGLRRDLLASLVVSALIIPQALGYAGIAGVPVQLGLYAIPLALIAYACLGTSRQLIVGPVSTVSVLSGSLVANQAAGNPALAISLTAGLAMAAGLWLIAAGVLGLGWVAEFLSKPIVTGFVFGLTLVIIVGELPNLLGLAPVTGDVFHRIFHIAGELGDVQPQTVAVSAVSLLVLFGGSRVAPRVPWGLLVLVGGTAISHALDLAAEGVRTVGDVPEGLPSLGLPGVPIDLLPSVIFGGAALALVGLAEGLSAARLFAQTGGYRVEANQELLAAGAANVGAGLAGGLGVAGSLSKTAAASRAGGRSQIVGLATALIVSVALVTVIGYIASLPRAVLSAIVVHAVWGLMDIEAMRRYRRVRRNDFVGAMVAMGGVLVFGTLYGLLIAVGQSVLGLIYRSSKVDADVMGKVEGEKAAWGSVSRHPERETVEGILVLRLDAPIFWVNAAEVRDRILATVDGVPGTRALILDLESTNQLDTSSADMLGGLLEDLQAREVDLHLVRVFHFVRGVLRRSGFEERLGPDHMWHSISQGVRSARARIAEADGIVELESMELEELDHPETIAVDHELADAVDDDEAEPLMLSRAGKGNGKQKGNGKKSKKDRKKKDKHNHH